VDEENLDVALLTEMATNPRSKRCKSMGDLKTGAWCYYTKDDGTTDGATYGKFYNWYAVMVLLLKRTQRPQPHK
jgi:hypothetical protein